jgi:glutaredoxin 3
MYTTATCSYCRNAKAILATYNITPEEIRIDINPSKMQEMREKTGMMSVPQIYIGNQHIGGFTELKHIHDQGVLAVKLQ